MGSEMCIRDRHHRVCTNQLSRWPQRLSDGPQRNWHRRSRIVRRQDHRSAVHVHQRRQRLGYVSEPRLIRAYAGSCLYQHAGGTPRRRRRTLGPTGTSRRDERTAPGISRRARLDLLALTPGRVSCTSCPRVLCSTAHAQPPTDFPGPARTGAWGDSSTSSVNTSERA